MGRPEGAAKCEAERTDDECGCLASHYAYSVCRRALLASAISVFLPFFTTRLVHPLYGSMWTIKYSLIGMNEYGGVILTICFMGAVVIFFHKKSSGIRQIVVGSMLIGAGLLVYFCKKDGFKTFLEEFRNVVSPGMGFFFLLFGGVFLALSGFVLVVINRVVREREKYETVYFDTI